MMKNMNIEVPDEIMNIINKLNTIPNTTSLIVGGAVRDAILGKTPKDWDISTNVPMEKIEELFPTYDIGNNKDFGIVVVSTDIGGVEIAQFRSDGVNRDDDNVVFIKDFEGDSNRRDFTFNALGYEPIKKEIYDYHNGVEDLNKGLLRFVGNPDKRIKEDPLRMMRAIRFSSVNNFQIETDSYNAIKRNKKLIENVSKERIYNEIKKADTKTNNKQFLNYMNKFNGLFHNHIFNTSVNFHNVIFALNTDIKFSSRIVQYFGYMKRFEEEKFPFENDVFNAIKNNIDYYNNYSKYLNSDYSFVENVMNNKNFDTLKDMIIVSGIAEKEFDKRVEKLSKYNNIKKQYNGKFIMETFNVKGKAVGELQRNIIKTIINNGE